MIKSFKRLLRDESGANIVEFAIALPILTLFIYGIFTIGMLFQASAGMQHALGEAARLATICIPDGGGCDVPDDDALRAMVADKKFGTGRGTLSALGIVNHQTAGVTDYKTLTLTYSQPTNFLFFAGPNITISRSKRVYLAS